MPFEGGGANRPEVVGGGRILIYIGDVSEPWGKLARKNN